MASELPPNASVEDIYEHLAFLDVCLDTVDADDVERLNHLEAEKSKAQALLNYSEPAPPDAHHSSRSSAKRPHSPTFDGDHRSSTRLSPYQSGNSTPSSSLESLSRMELADRIKRRQLLAEAAIQRRNEVVQQQRRADEEIAKRFSQSTSSSKLPTVQTTIARSGTWQRPALAKPEPHPAAGPSRQPFSDYSHTFRQPTAPSASTTAPSPLTSVKPERGLPNFQIPRRSNEVVDLTASDSEEDATAAAGTFGARSLPWASQSLQQPAAPRAPFRPAAIPRPSMPGSFPGFDPHGSIPSSSQYNRSGMMLPGTYTNPSYRMPDWMAQADAARRLAAGVPLFPGKFSGPRLNASGSSRAWPQVIDLEDEDLVYTGSRQLGPGYGMYTGQEDLYQRRYEDIANYDPAKTKEEINALLNNIRPDEEMPAHLRVATPNAMTVKLHKYQELGLTWLKNCEEGTNGGGILADDMGLGKTVQMLSLMVERKSDDPACRTTLIIAPVALLRQWKQEIEQKIKPGRHRMSVFTHHGSSKKTRFSDFQAFDVVLTTYGSLAAELKRLEAFQLRQHNNPDARPSPKERCVLIGADCRWYRVILDEAQCIKNQSTQTAKAAYLLRAKHRFCVTGTPMMNNVDELFSLVHFLRIKPFCQRDKFRTTFSQPLKGNGSDATREAAMSKLQALCKAVMLRRLKTSKFEGQPILILPEKTVNVDNPVFDEAELEFYQALEKNTALQFNKYYKSGTVGKAYADILTLLLRLRQACCHPHLIKDFSVAAAAGVTPDAMLEFAKKLDPQVVARIREKMGSFQCPICLDAAPNPALFFPCGHESCLDCFASFTDPANAVAAGNDGGGAKVKCPHCRGEIDTKQVIDFDSFKKVHQPELLSTPDENGDANVASGNSSGSDLASDSDSDSESDDDEESSSVNDFIVDDDEDVKEGDRPWSQNEADASDEDKKPGPSTRIKRPNEVKKSRKAKGKQKKKDKEERTKYKALTLGELKRRKDRASKKEYLKRVRENWTSSAKLDKTLEILQEIMVAPEGEKVLVFSQWTSLLDFIEVPIDERGWGYRRYDGSMSANMRGEAVDDFRDTSQDIRIMLVSLKAGNAGLNLNMASQVIILDPFWNPYIEEQAVDRAHRLGQTRPVQIHRVLIKDTVEDRIIALQEQKRALISEALDERAGQQIARLGVRELAYLFGVTSSLDTPLQYNERRR